MMQISENQLSAMLQDAAELGAKSALSQAGLLKPYISKAEAYRLAGERTVDRWMLEGLLIPYKDGPTSSKIRINRVQIEALLKTSNRPSYLALNERQ